MTYAVIRETENFPTEDVLEHAVISPPGLELPRLRCYLSFKHEDSTKPDYGRVQAWCLDDLRELWYNMDKDYSRAASRVAISQLMHEINILREPLRAEERFRLLACSHAMAQALPGRVKASSEESLEQRFERTLRSIMMENSGYVF